MSNQPFFFVDDEPISQSQVLEYLESAGKLEVFVEEILQQHAIALEFQAALVSKEVIDTYKACRKGSSQFSQAAWNVCLAWLLERHHLFIGQCQVFGIRQHRGGGLCILDT